MCCLTTIVPFPSHSLHVAGSRNGNGHADEGVGHNVDLPAEVLLDGNTVLSDHYAEITGEASRLVFMLPTVCPYLAKHFVLCHLTHHCDNTK